MNKIKIIRKIKSYFIKCKMHKILGFSADFLIYLGYLLKLSKWADNNKAKLEYNDFYNKKVAHKNRIHLYDTFANEYKLKSAAINYLEFGVGEGNSLKWWTENNTNPQTSIWAFDTYEGLPEKYGSYDIGTFNMSGNYPDISDKRINFIKGLFQDMLLSTIPQIDFKKKKSVIHIDADLYSAALFTLCVLYPYLKKGDIIIFDEFGVPGHEFKAFDDFIRSFYIKLKPIGAINNYLQLIFEVVEIKNVFSQNKK